MLNKGEKISDLGPISLSLARGTFCVQKLDEMLKESANTRGGFTRRSETCKRLVQNERAETGVSRYFAKCGEQVGAFARGLTGRDRVECSEKKDALFLLADPLNLSAHTCTYCD
jgi:hypothetical protein